MSGWHNLETDQLTWDSRNRHTANKTVRVVRIASWTGVIKYKHSTIITQIIFVPFGIITSVITVSDGDLSIRLNL